MSVDPINYIVGIDPGINGAIAFYTADHTSYITVEDMPVVDKAVSPAVLARRIGQMRPAVAVVEIASTRPGLSASSVLKTGTGYGVILGVLAALQIPTHLVTPQRWKRHFRLDSDKEKSRALAQRLWPEFAERFARVKDDGRAEAALMARWYAETSAKEIAA
jgi:crossover junction endodeoxyribonuclease RuvC